MKVVIHHHLLNHVVLIPSAQGTMTLKKVLIVIQNTQVVKEVKKKMKKMMKKKNKKINLKLKQLFRINHYRKFRVAVLLLKMMIYSLKKKRERVNNRALTKFQVVKMMKNYYLITIMSK